MASLFSKFLTLKHPPATRFLIFKFTATTIKDLHLAHWPEAVRKMAAHLKGLVEGVLKKKATTLAERRGSHERVETYACAGDSDVDLSS